MSLRSWFHNHSLKLLAIRDTPNAIAGGVAIGVFFGFSPLFGLKTILAIFFAWLTGSNILAAVVAGAMHDIFLPLMPAIYMWEYQIGYFILHHNWPATLHRSYWEGHSFRSWSTWLSFGKPLLLGGSICATPAAILAFFVSQRLVSRHQRKKHAQEIAAAEEANPS